MVSQWMTVTKPSRSDEVLDADQQLKMANQIRAQFDSMAPKRPTKPNRSEPDSTTTTTNNNNNNNNQSTFENIPELNKLRSLQSQSHVLFPGEGANTVSDEFVETQYYKELVSVDKDHHTTGSGFIRVVNEGNGYNIIDVGNGIASGDRPVYKSNPATNDWIPTVDYDQDFISSKPNRSEG